ncbi:sigma-70 family RNA polymerase sigma factor [Deinococcus sp. Arct2-2]|uniref:RNA polymerase sigma factor n=1 Tax=Deinococcus sp. Arct2-2 TaxID=2568653 RepID=UPI001F0D4E78|nr:sigma-70 family RNA polymerase sigma factor [Deinococcus sp. Arct2-2]
MDEEAFALLRLQHGDLDALTELHRQLGRQVYAVAFHLLQSPQEAEEVVQDTFLRLSERAGSYRPELGSPRAFIYTVARNAALSRLRARSSRPVSQEPEVGTEPQHHAWDGLEATNVGRADLDTQLVVQAAMQRLPNRDQTLILDAFFGGLSHPEIAVKRALPLGTVKSRLRRALRAMRHQLEDT